MFTRVHPTYLAALSVRIGLEMMSLREEAKASKLREIVNNNKYGVMQQLAFIKPVVLVQHEAAPN